MQSPSTPRAMIDLLNDLELRFKELQTTRIRDESTLNNLESILNEISTHLNCLTSSDDATLVAILLPSLLHLIFSLVTICSEGSDTIIPGPFLPREKLHSLVTMVKTFQTGIKEFVKAQKSLDLLKSTAQKPFLDQLRLVADSVINIDIGATCICHIFITRILVGSEDQQQSQRQNNAFKTEIINDGFLVSLYGSILRCLGSACEQYSRSVNRESVRNRVNALFHPIGNE